MLLQNSIAGIHFIGQDIPGFFKDPRRQDKNGKFVTDELLVLRWYQVGAFFPFCRAHAHEHTAYREPWTFSALLLNEIRDVLRFRYELLPYLYTCFRHSSRHGVPLMRPLWYNYPEDSNTNMIEDQFCLGEDIMVKVLADEG
jgi:alpha 1,3-glucosidase